MIATLGAAAMQNLDFFAIFILHEKSRKENLSTFDRNNKERQILLERYIYYYRQIISINHPQTPIARVIDRNAQWRSITP